MRAEGLRAPHGVHGVRPPLRRVEGERDPRGARLVLHGWFTEPEPHFEGGLGEEEVMAGLTDALGACYGRLSPPCVTGLLAVRLTVAADGAAASLELLADTLVADPAQLGLDGAPSFGEAREAALAAISEALGEATFAPSDAPTQITIPFAFD